MTALHETAVYGDLHTTLHTVLLGIHLIGLCIGFGIAIFLDFFTVYAMYTKRRISSDFVRMFHLGGNVILIGLVVLWFSGIGFLIDMALNTPEALSNQKIWAKVIIVLVLTFNGMMIHQITMGKLKNNVGTPLFELLSPRQAAFLTLNGSVSAVSWFYTFGLGLNRDINNKYTIGEILTVYGILVLVVSILAYGSMYLIKTKRLKI